MHSSVGRVCDEDCPVLHLRRAICGITEWIVSLGNCSGTPERVAQCIESLSTTRVVCSSDKPTPSRESGSHRQGSDRRQVPRPRPALIDASQEPPLKQVVERAASKQAPAPVLGPGRAVGGPWIQSTLCPVDRHFSAETAPGASALTESQNRHPYLHLRTKW